MPVSTDPTPVALEPQAESALNQLESRVEGVRHRNRGKFLITGLAMSLAVVVFAFLGFSAADILFKLSVGGRFLAMFASLAGIAAAMSYFLVRPWRQMGGRVDAARTVEGKFPELEEQLSTALEFGAHPHLIGRTSSPALVGALMKQTAQRAEPLDFAKTIHWRTAIIAGLLAFGLGACMAGYHAISPRLFSQTLARFVNPASSVPPPTMTVINDVKPGNDELAVESSVPISADVGGVMPDRVVMSVFVGDEKNDRWEDRPMDRGEDGKFHATLHRLLESTRYKIQAGDAEAGEYKIDVYKLPEVSEFALRLEYPAYTGKQSETLPPNTGDVRALKGTMVFVELKSNTELSSATVKFKSGRSVAMGNVNSAEPRKAAIQFKIEKDDEYQIELFNSKNKSGVSAPYIIKSLIDRPPRVTIREPERDLMVHREQTVKIEIVADDDIGVGEIGLFHNLGADEEKKVMIRKMDPPTVRADGKLVWELGNLGLKGGEVIAYYAYAYDNDSPPKMAKSEIHFLTVYDEQDYNSPQSPQKQPPTPQSVKELDKMIEAEKKLVKETFAQANLSKDSTVTSRDAEKAAAMKTAEAQKALRVKLQDLVEKVKKDMAQAPAEDPKQVPPDGGAGPQPPAPQPPPFGEKEIKHLETAMERMNGAEDKLHVPNASEAVRPETEALRHLSETRRLLLSDKQGDPRFKMAMDKQSKKRKQQDQEQQQQDQQEMKEKLAEMPKMMEREKQTERDIEELQAKKKNNPPPAGEMTPQQKQEQDAQRNLQKQAKDDLEQLAKDAEDRARKLEKLTPRNPEVQPAAEKMQQAADKLNQASREMQQPNPRSLDAAKEKAQQANQDIREAQRNLRQATEKQVRQELANLQKDAQDLAQKQQDLAQQARDLQKKGDPAKSEKPGEQSKPGEQGQPKGDQAKAEKPGEQSKPGESGKPGEQGQPKGDQAKADKPGEQSKPGESGKPGEQGQPKGDQAKADAQGDPKSGDKSGDQKGDPQQASSNPNGLSSEQQMKSMMSGQRDVQSDLKDLEERLDRMAERAQEKNLGGAKDLQKAKQQAGDRSAANQAAEKAEEALNKGKLDDAQRETAQAAKALEQMAGSIQSAAQNTAAGDMKELANAMKKVQSLAKEQGDINKDLAQKKESANAASREEQISSGAQELAKTAENLEALRHAARDGSAKDKLEEASQKAHETAEALKQQDPSGAKAAGDSAEKALNQAMNDIERATGKMLEEKAREAKNIAKEARENQEKVNADAREMKAGAPGETMDPASEAKRAEAEAKETQAARDARRLDRALDGLQELAKDANPAAADAAHDAREQTEQAKLPTAMDDIAKGLNKMAGPATNKEAADPTLPKTPTQAAEKGEPLAQVLRNVDKNLDAYIAEATGSQLDKLKAMEQDARDASKALEQLQKDAAKPDANAREMDAKTDPKKGDNPGKADGDKKPGEETPNSDKPPGDKPGEGKGDKSSDTKNNQKPNDMTSKQGKTTGDKGEGGNPNSDPSKPDKTDAEKNKEPEDPQSVEKRESPEQVADRLEKQIKRLKLKIDRLEPNAPEIAKMRDAVTSVQQMKEQLHNQRTNPNGAASQGGSATGGPAMQRTSQTVSEVTEGLVNRIERLLRAREVKPDQDEDAPKEYRSLVDKYYRALSEDVEEDTAKPSK